MTSPDPDVLEAENGRSPFWGIVAGVVLIIFIALALWRATANDGSSSSLDYSSQVAPTSIIAGAATASGSHKSTGATTVFFFGMFGVMAVVAAGLVWRTQRVNHPRRT